MLRRALGFEQVVAQRGDGPVQRGLPVDQQALRRHHLLELRGQAADLLPLLRDQGRQILRDRLGRDEDLAQGLGQLPAQLLLVLRSAQ